MALLKSEPFTPGLPCPPFRLETVDSQVFDRDDLVGSKGFLIAFICNHCPYVSAIEDRLIALAKRYKPLGLMTVGICSNDANRYPDDAKEALFERWKKKNYGFPYLLDDDQTVAKAFGAVCTPDLYLYDHRGLLFYHGRLDDNWQDEQKVHHQDLANAIDLVLANKAPPAEQHPSMGCSIKWRE
jgi:peroxiredoxin